jgi:hypothetical protein
MTTNVLLSILAILFNVLGTYYISKTLFFNALAFPIHMSSYKSIDKKFRKISLLEKISAFIFNIKTKDYLDKLTFESGLSRSISKETLKKFRDKKSSIKGFFFIALGSTIQIILLLF